MSHAFKLKSLLDRFSLTQQFLGLTTLILVVGMSVIGYWVGRQIETNSIQQAVSMATIYVESILVDQKRDWSTPQLDDTTHDALDRLFLTGPLQRIVVRFKFWHPDGTIFYSNDHGQIGQRLKMESALQAAFRGQTWGHVSELGGDEHEHERDLGTRLLEVFVPVRSAGRDEVVAVAEFYYTMESIDRDIHDAQRSTWWVVVFSTASRPRPVTSPIAAPKSQAVKSMKSSVARTATNQKFEPE